MNDTETVSYRCPGGYYSTPRCHVVSTIWIKLERCVGNKRYGGYLYVTWTQMLKPVMDETPNVEAQALYARMRAELDPLHRDKDFERFVEAHVEMTFEPIARMLGIAGHNHDDEGRVRRVFGGEDRVDPRFVEVSSSGMHRL